MRFSVSNADMMCSRPARRSRSRFLRCRSAAFSRLCRWLSVSFSRGPRFRDDCGDDEVSGACCCNWSIDGKIYGRGGCVLLWLVRSRNGFVVTVDVTDVVGGGEFVTVVGVTIFLGEPKRSMRFPQSGDAHVRIWRRRGALQSRLYFSTTLSTRPLNIHSLSTLETSFLYDIFGRTWSPIDYTTSETLPLVDMERVHSD